MLPAILLIIPIITASLFLFINKRLHSAINLLGSLAAMVTGLYLSVSVFVNGPVSFASGIFYIDILSAFIIVIVSIISFISTLYSLNYMKVEVMHGSIEAGKMKWYYFLLHLFTSTMLLVTIVNNLGVMWVAIEATTLASALLVGFYNKEASLEAAWKYVIICTVGITFALFGIILAYYSSVSVLGQSSNALNWVALQEIAGKLNPRLIKLSFIFILIGFGTKAGLAPMHTWLPDAHSQAPSPVSALLSGVLLNTTLYAILRFHIIANKSVGNGFSSNLLMIFGLISIAIAVPFIILQYDFKRMLAYSSVEHIGIVTFAVGLGGEMGLFGALLHLFNHAMAKSLMFMVAGNITQKYKTKKMARIKGVLEAIPYTGTMLMIGVLAITGMPPFSIFTSEFIIANAGFSQGKIIAGMLFLGLLALIFTGMFYHAAKMAFGEKPLKIQSGETSVTNLAAMTVPLAFILTMGLYVPPYFREVLDQIVLLLRG